MAGFAQATLPDIVLLASKARPKSWHIGGQSEKTFCAQVLDIDISLLMLQGYVPGSGTHMFHVKKKSSDE